MLLPFGWYRSEESPGSICVGTVECRIIVVPKGKILNYAEVRFFGSQQIEHPAS